jgi:hypothetical protein
MPDRPVQGEAVRLDLVSTKLSDRGTRIRRVKWVELSCLLCGEWVATLEGGSLRPRRESSARVEGRRVVCGRCGGSLSPTDQGERVHFI